MAISKENQRIYKYDMEAFEILPASGDAITIPPLMVNAILIERDYDINFFPVLTVKVMLTTSQYYALLGSKTTSKIRLRITKYVYTSDDKFKFKRDFINDTYTVFIDDDTPFSAEKEYKTITKETSSGSTPNDTGGKEFTLHLFKEKDLESSKKVINKVVASATVKDAVAYLLSKSGISTKVLFVDPDNRQQYSELILYPYTVIGNVLNIDKIYGFHLSGTLFFYDLNYVYFIDKSGKCKAWALSEYKKTTFNIKNSDNVDGLSSGTYDDAAKKEFYINVEFQNMTLDSPSTTNDQIGGNNALYLDPTSGETIDASTKTSQVGSGSSRVKLNNYSNKYTVSAYKRRTEEQNHVVNISLADFDTDSLTPNKEYVMTFENTAHNKNYGGNYRLAATMITLIKNGNSFSIMGTAFLNKCPS